MANRKLYGEKSFVIERVDEFPEVWHILGSFTPGSIKSKHKRWYRVRVEPDERWRGLRCVAFCADSIYECESVSRRTRRHVYGSGKWYISPSRPDDWDFVLNPGPGEFVFGNFVVLEEAGRAERLGEGLRLSFFSGWHEKRKRSQWEARGGGTLYILKEEDEYNSSEGVIPVERCFDLVPGKVVLVERI